VPSCLCSYLGITKSLTLHRPILAVGLVVFTGSWNMAHFYTAKDLVCKIHPPVGNRRTLLGGNSFPRRSFHPTYVLGKFPFIPTNLQLPPGCLFLRKHVQTQCSARPARPSAGCVMLVSRFPAPAFWIGKHHGGGFHAHRFI
jgi:hypothetical protein